jgi:hypothetical protein
MILNQQQIDRLKEFLLKEPTEEELVRCNECWGWKNSIEKCENGDICQRYTPTDFKNLEGTENLVKDLFDTIENLLNNNEGQ